jgi:hypothetical protein
MLRIARQLEKPADCGIDRQTAARACRDRHTRLEQAARKHHVIAVTLHALNSAFHRRTYRSARYRQQAPTESR